MRKIRNTISVLKKTKKTMDKKMTITKKIILLYIFFILIPALYFMYFYYEKSLSIIENEITNSILATLIQTEGNISYRLNNIEEISNLLFSNNKLHEMISPENEAESIGQQIDEQKELRSIISSFDGNRDIFRIRFFLNGNKLYTKERINFFPVEFIQDKDWYQQIVVENGRIFWKSTYGEKYIDILNTDSTNIMSCARLIKSFDDYSKINGILVIDILEKSISDTLPQFGKNRNNNAFIVDSNSKIISHRNSEMVGGYFTITEGVSSYNNDNGDSNNSDGNNSVNSLLSGKQEGISQQFISGKKQYIIYKKIRKTNWYIVASVPVEEITENSRDFNSLSGAIFVIVTFGFFILTFLLISLFVVGGLNKRIKQIINVIKKQGIDSLDVSAVSNSGDIYKLESSVDKMAATIKDLVEEVYSIKMDKREAEFKALQSQINPHFLYNTLDTINWMSIRNETEDITFMLGSLAKYYRLMLKKGRDLVRIEDEVELAKTYLELQRMTFMGSFDYNIAIEDDTLKYVIPKLVLQPIVENSLVHGIQKCRGRKGEIAITSKFADDDEIIIIINDNGAGMDKETANCILLPSTSISSKGYGLYNVNERLKIYFGAEYGISIESEKGKGTKVIVKIKAINNSNIT